MTRLPRALPSPPPARHASEAGACRGRRRGKATEKSLHRVLLAGRERRREGMRRLHAYLWSKHAAAREPVGTLAVLGQVESLELGLFGDAQRPEEQLQSEKDTGG